MNSEQGIVNCAAVCDRYEPLFDLAEAERHRDVGIGVATEHRGEVLTLAKAIAREIALARDSRECSADDVAKRLTKGQRAALGNAAGAIFRGREWRFVRSVKCQRINAHARDIRLWRLVGS